ncbi:MAG: hypothetical protein ACI84O_000227 [Myxococcota bacterium]|jgi:hypothetical protein
MYGRRCVRGNPRHVMKTHNTSSLAILSLLAIFISSCGAADGNITDSQPQPENHLSTGGGINNADRPAYDPIPYPSVATFYMDHDDTGAGDVPPGDAAKGFANTYTSEEVMSVLASTGNSGGLFRHDLRMHMPLGSIAPSLIEGKNIGMDTWLTIMGTPLDQSPSTEGELYSSGLPPYARWTPMDVDLWADGVITQLEAYESTYGFVPDNVEIWNEPDRREFYSDDLASYLTIYTALSQKIKNRWPSINVGGMGLAGHASTMGGTESAILALIDHVAANNLPLDFVSWHHYAIANELRYSGFIADVRERLATHNITGVKLVVSEWNIYPSTNSHGPEFDGSHSAANYAGFQTAARELGLDGNIMFLLQDAEFSAGPVSDLTGKGMGILTAHGIKKPVFHVIDTLQQMASEPVISTIRLEDELSVNVYATTSAGRIRYVVSNDVVLGDWVWANRLRDAGLLPSVLWPLYYDAANIGAPHRPSASELIAVGMTSAEAAAIAAIETELNLAWRFAEEDRLVKIIFGDQGAANIANVYRFDSQHNNIAENIGEILPYLEAAEDNSYTVAMDEVIAFFASNGIYVTAAELELYDDIENWAINNNVPFTVSTTAVAIFRKSRHSARMLDSDFLNSLPQMSISSMTAAEAELTTENGSISFLMEPDSVVIFDVYL